MKNVTVNSRVYPYQWEREKVESDGDVKELFLDSSESFAIEASRTEDDSNFTGSNTVEDQQHPGDCSDRLESIHLENNFDSSSEEAVTANSSHNSTKGILNKTGKYEQHKKNHETERDRKIMFADHVESYCDMWEENYYVETHYSTKDLFGNDVLAQGLRCKCAIL